MGDNSLLLSLDSSHIRGSAAVTNGCSLLSSVFFNASDTHSATLLPAIDSALRMAGADLGDMGSFAVVIGPGSFTGLRIGLSTIKAFAAVNGSPVYTVSSLELLASAFPYCAMPVASVIDARRDEVYFALYRTVGGLPEEIIAPSAVRPDEVSGIISAAAGGEKALACGTGAARYKDILRQDGIMLASEGRAFPSASYMAQFTEISTAVNYEELGGLEPAYIRPPDAKPSVKLIDKRG